MKIAIHHTKGSFSDRWIAYCEKQLIPYKIVDCYRNDIIQQLEDCTALMWHYHHAHPKDTLFAKQLMYSVAAMGKKIFPDFNTAWHFDDKVGQKYLLEAVNAPLVPSFVFYDKQEALGWVNTTSFPKVFKLRSGSSSANVSLAKTKEAAADLVNTAFGEGFTQFNGWLNFKERLRKFKKGQTTLFDVSKGFIRIFHNTEFSKVAGREKGYIYFQDFIANNDSDIRIIVVDEKAFAIKRMVRENDFRASGGGTILYDKELFDIEAVKVALDVTRNLKAQCLAYDFVYDNGKPLIVEISYGYANEAYDPCQGYWDKELNWHEGPLVSQNWMVDLMLK
jgi:glutathione synthase/RimK-type ligase-like ATP-grasp enzyme